ncbi:hypothetical protein KY314_04630 [Candidatus Woesearchaeota archaeon]|nr:hypothetical protein [Candidatus Woesearchaeota archaeon]
MANMIYSQMQMNQNNWNYIVYNFEENKFASGLTFNEAYKKFLELKNGKA